MARDRRPRDDDDDEEDRPRRRRRPADDDDEDDEPRAKKRRVADEDDEDDERPRRKARVRDEDDDEDDDRPRRRKKSRKPAGMSKGLLFGLIGGGVALVGVVVLLIVLLSGGSSPKDVMKRVAKALRQRDYGTLYDNLSTKSQENADTFAFHQVVGTGEPRERFIFAMNNGQGIGRGTPFGAAGNITILGETIHGNTAVVKFRDNEGNEMNVPFIKENGRWKLNCF